MSAEIIDGKAYASRLKDALAEKVGELKAKHDIEPCVSFVLVGDDPASHYYINAKAKTCASLGIISRDHKFASTTSREALRELITTLNDDNRVHGILIQLPLPAHLNEREMINTIDPVKDVDGFHPVNAGRLATGEKGMVACTPLGSLMLIRHALGQDIAGKHAVVLGRSNIVGKPMGQLLLNAGCTVTICHSRTPNSAELSHQADIVVAAVGKPHLVKADWIKPGACVIDVGINRVENGDGTGRLVGDVAFDNVKNTAGFLTPVPGGVGPMTIACLMRNTVEAACIQHNLPFTLKAFI